MAIVYMTEEGYKKMLEEITFLETVKRPEISRQIAEARDKGDLSENAEYDAAKEAQGLLEMKIAQLKDKVANARMIDDTKLNTHTVQILNKLKLFYSILQLIKPIIHRNIISYLPKYINNSETKDLKFIKYL